MISRSWACCILCTNCRRCLLLLGWNLRLFLYKITFLYMCPYFIQCRAEFHCVRCCRGLQLGLFLPWKHAGRLISRQVFVQGPKHSIIKTPLLFPRSFLLNTIVLKFPIPVNDLLYYQVVTTFSVWGVIAGKIGGRTEVYSGGSWKERLWILRHNVFWGP